MLPKPVKRLLLAALLGAVFNVGAAPLGSYAYRTDVNDVANMDSFRIYQGDPSAGALGYWMLDGSANSIFDAKLGVWKHLGTNQFTVNNILDITYAQNAEARDVAYLRTTVGNFAYYTDVNDVASMDSFRIYQGDPSAGALGYWMLDGSTNSIFDAKIGVWKHLGTNQFTVNDILDITYAQNGAAHDVAYLRTTAGNFAYYTDVNGVASMDSFRIYQGDPSAGALGYWMLDGSTNSIFDPKLGTWSHLTTTAFSVDDIQDITFSQSSPGVDTAYFTVSAPVPEPATWLLSLVGLGMLMRLTASQRRSRQGLDRLG